MVLGMKQVSAIFTFSPLVLLKQKLILCLGVMELKLAALQRLWEVKWKPISVV